jgi:hypothetical protein
MDIRGKAYAFASSRALRSAYGMFVRVTKRRHPPLDDFGPVAAFFDEMSSEYQFIKYAIYVPEVHK